MDKNANDKYFTIITGGSRGLGYCLAEEFLSQGYKVAITAKNADSLSDAKGKLKERYSDNLYAYQLDLSNEDSIHHFFKCIDMLNLKSLILINNAGLGHSSSFKNMEDSHISEIFNTNFFGHVKIIKHFYPLLKKRGSIINIFSVLALRPIRNWSLYAAAKSAFSTLATGMQMEYDQHGINILNVYPGKINTSFSQKALGDVHLKTNSESGSKGACPNILAKKIFKKFIKKRRGQLFYPLSTRILFILHALSIDLTSKLLNHLLKNHEQK